MRTNTETPADQKAHKVLSLLLALSVVAGLGYLLLTNAWFKYALMVMNISVIGLISFLLAKEVLNTLKNRL